MSQSPSAAHDRERPCWWTTVLELAIASDDHEVTLVEGDRNSVQVAIDGVEVFDGVGYAIETFTIGGPWEYLDRLTSGGDLKVEEVSHGA